MASKKISTADIVGMMPKALQSRFESLGPYVLMVIDEAGLDDPPPAKEEVQFIQLVALVYALDQFFRAGTRAALGASLAFESLGAVGFTVGAAPFTSEGENTFRGERLAEALRASITDEKVRDLLGTSKTMKDLVSALARWLRHGRSLG